MVLGQPPEDPMHPDGVTIASVRKFYMDYHGNSIRSSDAAKRAFKLVTQYLGAVGTSDGAPKVGDFTIARQDGFMRWCRDRKLSGKTISTYLSYYKAGLKFSSVPRLITDARGIEREARVLSFVPHINDGEEYVSKVTGLQRSKPRDWIPNDAELCAFIDAIEHEHVFRYVMIALNTWARPEAICELNVIKQADFQRRRISLNPPDRVQNKKVRPTIPMTDNLFGWLKTWNREYPIHDIHGERIAEINNRTIKKAARRAGVESTAFTRYTLRHYMATRVRRVEGFTVTREERAAWLGHTDPNHRTTEAWYESMDADYLLAAKGATDGLIVSLSRLCKVRSLIPPMMQHRSGLMVIESVQDGEAKKGAG